MWAIVFSCYLLFCISFSCVTDDLFHCWFPCCPFINYLTRGFMRNLAIFVSEFHDCWTLSIYEVLVNLLPFTPPLLASACSSNDIHCYTTSSSHRYFSFQEFRILSPVHSSGLECEHMLLPNSFPTGLCLHTATFCYYIYSVMVCSPFLKENV